MDEALLTTIRAALPHVKMPGPYAAVYNDQCMFSFDNPYSPGGLYVNMATHQGFGEEWVGLDHERSHCPLYVHLRWRRVRKAKPDSGEVSKVAIGVEGGFDPDNAYDTIQTNAVCVFPSKATVPLPCPDLPELVIQAANAIISHEGSANTARVTWEEESYAESRFARDLVQLNTGKKVAPDPKTWVDEETGECSDNLWLNLSTGHIGGGRRQMNANGEWTGSGSALQHFLTTGRQYPLAVKLGTISARGADVYSYAEDAMVLDPKLPEHLAHWGINMMQMEKTGKSMAEMNVDLNLQFEYSRILENDKALQPVTGPGYIGLDNLGNSCYMNSVLQTLFALPEVRARYVDPAERLFRSAPPEVAEDFPAQMAKVGRALYSSRYAVALDVKEEDPNQPSLRPYTFKRLVGKGHPEFSSDRQQDAAEYFQFLLEYMARVERPHSARLGADFRAADLFRFETETRLECAQSRRVRYSRGEHTTLDLPVPLECATNRSEYEEYRSKRQKVSGDGERKDPDPVLARVPFDACLQKFAAQETVADFLSSVTQTKGEAYKSVRIHSFPKYLMIQLRKFYVDTDWTVKKMEVELVDVPDDLDLEWLRAAGPQPGEDPLPETSGGGKGPLATSAPEADPTIVAMVTSLGFPEARGRQAALATGNRGAEEAVNWILAHLDDPLPPPTDQPLQAADPQHVSMLQDMGFTAQQAAVALKACDGSVERAVDWLFSHADELDTLCAQAGASPVAAPPPAPSAGSVTPAAYTLIGFVSHLGKNTGCGHYVVHLKRDGKWVLYNDRKVGMSETLPRGMGYLYLYARK